MMNRSDLLLADRGLSNARFAAEAPLKGDPRSAHLVKILQPSQPRIECVLTSIRPYAARRLDELHSSPPFSGENGTSDKRTKTNSERIGAKNKTRDPIQIEILA